MSLFGAATGVVDEITLPDVNNVDKREMLNWERELIGLYISDHPLTPYQTTFARIVSYFSGQLGDDFEIAQIVRVMQESHRVGFAVTDSDLNGMLIGHREVAASKEVQ